MTQGRHICIAIESMRNGGAQRVVATLIREWNLRQTRVTLVTFQSEESDFYSLPSEVTRIVLGGNKSSPNFIAGAIANVQRLGSLRRALRSTNAQTIVSFLTPMNVLVILASLGLGKRVVVSERNDPVRQRPKLFWGLLRRLTYPMAHAVTANSQHAVNVLERSILRISCVAVPNPVSLPTSAAQVDASTLVLSVGRLVPQKRHEIVISAFGILLKSHPGWRLAILGEGPSGSDLKAQITTEHLEDRVELPGSVRSPNAYYAAAGIFVLASDYEGMPNALLEAMSHGLPCVVADCLPGALEYLEDGVSGLVFRSRDVDDLARCLTALASDPNLRARLGASARQRMMSLSSDKIIQKWDAIFRFP